MWSVQLGRRSRLVIEPVRAPISPLRGSDIELLASLIYVRSSREIIALFIISSPRCRAQLGDSFHALSFLGQAKFWSYMVVCLLAELLFTPVSCYSHQSLSQG